MLHALNFDFLLTKATADLLSPCAKKEIYLWHTSGAKLEFKYMHAITWRWMNWKSSIQRMDKDFPNTTILSHRCITFYSSWFSICKRILSKSARMDRIKSRDKVIIVPYFVLSMSVQGRHVLANFRIVHYMSTLLAINIHAYIYISYFCNQNRSTYDEGVKCTLCCPQCFFATLSLVSSCWMFT
jgi:hypothetical protein